MVVDNPKMVVHNALSQQLMFDVGRFGLYEVGWGWLLRV